MLPPHWGGLLMCRWLCVFAACSLAVACNSSSVPGLDADITTGESFRLEFPPHPVPAGVEDTQCVELRLGNPEAIQVSQISTMLDGASHHLIVYKSAATQQRPDPFPCTPFVATLAPESASVPLMVTQIDREVMSLPEGVSLPIDADQMIRIEMHYLNASDTDREVTASIDFYRQPPEQYEHEASFLFIGNPDIELDPGPSTLGPVWFPMPQAMAGINIFGITGHTHQWGTNVEIDMLKSQNSSEPVPAYKHDAWDWEEPPVNRFAPPLEMTTSSGFQFSCSYDNQSGRRVFFGESTEDEMCFFWSYYYPSRGHKVCIHTDQLGFPLNVCCPGDAVCDMIDIGDL